MSDTLSCGCVRESAGGAGCTCPRPPLRPGSIRRVKPEPEPDEAERVVQAWLFPHDEYEPGTLNETVRSLTGLLRAAERRGWERACEESAKECEDVATLRAGYAESTAPSHRLVESFAAETLRYVAARIRALRERGPR